MERNMQKKGNDDIATKNFGSTTNQNQNKNVGTGNQSSQGVDHSGVGQNTSQPLGTHKGGMNQ